MSFVLDRTSVSNIGLSCNFVADFGLRPKLCVTSHCALINRSYTEIFGVGWVTD